MSSFLLSLLLVFLGLMNENTGLKTELSELRGKKREGWEGGSEGGREASLCILSSPVHFSSLQSQYNDSLQTIQNQQSLINQLEGDLACIQPYLPPRTEGEVNNL